MSSDSDSDSDGEGGKMGRVRFVKDDIVRYMKKAREEGKEWDGKLL